MLISGKGKYFHVFGCISKNFPENIFWCLEKKKEKTNPRKISSMIAIRDCDLAIDASRDRAVDRDRVRRRDCDQLRDLVMARDRAVDRDLRGDLRTRDRRFLELRVCRRSSDWLFGFFSSRARTLSLSLSLFFRKCFEVKMRGENHFWVKGENIGQPKVIFRKISFSVTAKHAEKGDNDFLKSFSPKTNAP